MKALALHVTGIVQGVGFRPFVYNLALGQRLTGWVLNASDGVHCVVEGPATVVDAFPRLLREQAPAMSVIEDVIAEQVEPEGFTDFEIRSSVAEDGSMTLVSPDIATCPACLEEMTDGADRRHRYPFINCTNCGPRFTIIDDVPYDRPLTTMADFPMCDECAAEYEDPADRRFHAQPNACWVCGPRLYLNETTSAEEPDSMAGSDAEDRVDGGWAWGPEREPAPRPHRVPAEEMERSERILQRAVELLHEGSVLAVKGLGGFQLACDARNPDAVARLRSRKHRWGKPLAVMVRDVEAAEAFCEVSPTEAELLSGPVRPIVLLRKKPSARASTLATGVADLLCEVGVMLPYTPLHHLLLGAFGGPLVMTSGNRSDEPIATDNAEALERLSDIADAFLLHDRAIHSRYDDSVLRVVNEAVEPVRRARGLAPHPLTLPFASDVHVLACGPEQKNTFTLLKRDYAFVSQHIGDLENAETLDSFEETLVLYERLFRIRPEIVAHDLHPEYLSTKWAQATDLPKVAVQHHHAHVVSVTAEHGVSDRVIGVAFDGTGYGEDGAIWGGEFLLADWEGFERAAHLRYVPMPGGAAAIRRPARMAVGLLYELGLLEHPGARPLLGRLADGEQSTLVAMMRNGINSPLTSSMGRLFDAVSAIAGVADDAGYEGEAAILLEAAADPEAVGVYEFGVLEDGRDGGPQSGPKNGPERHAAVAPRVIDSAPIVEAILDDVASGASAATISRRFHSGIVRCIVRECTEFALSTGTRHVALSGGVFMNRLVLGESVRALAEAGLVPLTHVRLPMNDAAVSFGQAVVAHAKRHQA